ncbi:hypothetical protein ACWEKT_02560 [Nocardia takedensis]|uniref:hypothetical protein n=1 Tax=Nocardia takedensis TaxID=259390 RepID=UPI00030C9763|nr:hypothetical protein [Nocardia takedensis]
MSATPTTRTVTDLGTDRSRRTEPPTPYFPFVSAVLLAAAIAGMIIDVILAKAAFDVIVNESEFVSALVATGVAGIAAVTALGGGLAWRHGHRLGGAALLAGWLLIGITLAALRWQRGSLEGFANDPADRWIAMLMLAVFLAAGIEIATHGSALLDNDSYFAVRSARRAVAKIDRKRNRVAAEYGRIALALSRFPDIRDRARRQHEMAQQRIDSMERELHAYARDQVVEALRNSRNGGLTAQPVAIDDFPVRERARSRTNE